MAMANQKEIFVALDLLMAAYDHAMPDKQVESYVTALRPYDRVRIYNAARALIEKQKFYPKISEIISEMRHQTRQGEQLSDYPGILPQDKQDRELIWIMCRRGINDPYELTEAELRSVYA